MGSLVGCLGLLDLSTFRDCQGQECAAAPDASAGDVSIPEGGDAADSGVQKDASLLGTSPGVFGADLVLWLDAEKGVLQSLDGGTVQAWNDQSQHGAVASQSTEALRPLFVPADIHGHAALLFQQSDHGLIIPDANQFQFGDANDFVIEVVMKMKSNSSPLFLWNKAQEVGLMNSQFTNGLIFGFGIDSTVTNNPMVPLARMQQAPAQTSADNPIGANVPHVVGLRRLPVLNDAGHSTLQHRTDGNQQSTVVAIYPIGEPNSPVRIGGYKLKGAINQQPTDLHIAEIVAVSKPTISDGEVQALEAWLKSKYGI